MVIATTTVNLASGWSTVWTAVSGALGSKLTTLMTAIGVILVVLAILGWLWERRKGGMSGNHNKLLWTLLIGAILVAPNLLIPLLLNIADFIANAIINLLGA